MLSGRHSTNMASSGSQAQPQQAQYQNNSIINGRQTHSVTPSSFHSTTPTNFNINQRSVPNLTQLLQQKQRVFLSPQPSNSDSNTNLSSRSPNQMPYYADLIPINSSSPNVPVPLHSQSIIRPRVHGEWKSVENLPQSLTPRSTKTIDFGESPGNNIRQGERISSNQQNHSSSSAKNLNLTFDLINTYGNSQLSDSSKEFPEYAKIIKNDEMLSSPEYDQIRTPPEPILQHVKDKGRPGTIIGSSSLVHDTNNKVNFHIHGMTPNAFSPSSKVKTSVSLFSPPLGSGNKNGAESTDCSSLGRSSTSDGDFGTLGDPSAVSNNFINAGK